MVRVMPQGRFTVSCAPRCGLRASFSLHYKDVVSCSSLSVTSEAGEMCEERREIATNTVPFSFSLLVR